MRLPGLNSFPSKLVLGAVALLTFSRPVAAEQTTLALPTITLGFLSQYIAADKGFWSDQGLQVTVRVIQGIGSTNAVISGGVDFAMSAGPSLTRANARGQKLIGLATLLDQTDEYVVIRKDIAEKAHFDPSAPLSIRARILKGRTIAVGGTAALPDTVLKVIAIEAGLARDNVTTTPMLPAEFMAAFARKSIDGFVAGPPFPQATVLDGTGVLVSHSAQGEPKNYSPVAAGLLLTRASFCPEHRPICAKMVHGLVVAARFIHDHPKQTLAVMKAHFGNNLDKVLEASYRAVRSMTPVPPITTPKELENADLMNVAAGFLQRADLLPSYNEIIDNEFTK